MGATTKIVIHTDGACRGNPGPGGWGVVIASDGALRELAGSEPQTTNNRMELIAAIQALTHCTQDQSIRLITDSEYLRKGITEWLQGWKSRGWKTAARKPVKNRDLWEALDGLTTDLDIEWQWVKGHSGDPGNEHADRLANEAIDRLQRGDASALDTGRAVSHG